LADEIIEDSKNILAEPGVAAAKRIATLRKLLADSLKLLHPFMPFVTEEIWQLGQFDSTRLLMISPWPTND
jgi:valyl-tRNA synthetase